MSKSPLTISRSISKQMIHMEHKENAKFIKELQNRASKKELQERNKQILVRLNGTEANYLNKYSMSKILSKVTKRRKQREQIL